MNKDSAAIYEIRINSNLDKRWNRMFDNFTLAGDDGLCSCLTGRVNDQAELIGLLRRVHDLGLTLLSVNRIDTDSREEYGGKGK